jgi:hypothetical protein
MRCAPDSFTQQQALETGGRGTGARIGAPHMVDDDRQIERLQNRNGLRQILDVDPKLQMPAEVFYDGREYARGGERYATAIMQLAALKKMIEP